MAVLRVGSVFQQSWAGVVNPMRFEVLELDRSRDNLRVNCFGSNGFSHEEEWQGAMDGLKFTENCIDIGEYEIIEE